MSNIRIGTGSWTDPTLIKCGRFYPRMARTAGDRLIYYASQLNLVEVDSTYYALPSEKTSQLWMERTKPGFIFDIKAFRLFTQHPTPLIALPSDIRRELPGSGNGSIYATGIPEGLIDELWARFRRALQPLVSAGKLGVVLFQFPPWFATGSRENEYILLCQSKMSGFNIAVEFRNSSWLNEKSREQTLNFLRENSLAFVCVDEPQGFSSSVPPVIAATSDIALVRFHGRNAKMWEAKGISTAERFNYLYSEQELMEWVPGIRQLAAQTKQLHVLFNNCYEDKALTNARQIKFLLD